jgi:hypothetical protein
VRRARGAASRPADKRRRLRTPELRRAANPRDAAKAADRLLRDGVDFATAWSGSRKAAARTATPAGPQTELVHAAGLAFENTIDVPAGYDPSRRWPVRVQLHGGINRPDPQPSRRDARTDRGATTIVVLPSGWNGATWWQSNQADNILTLVDRVKRRITWTNRASTSRASPDGGTGVLFAMREATPWSACLPPIGHLGVLSNPTTGVEGGLYAGNLVNCPFFIVISLRDTLYPAARMMPYIDLMQRAGVRVVLNPQALTGHDTTWWPSEKAAYEQFVRDHPRAPYAERLSWETDRIDRYNRVRWLVVDALGPTAHDAALERVETLSVAGGASEPLFEHHRRSGRVDVVRRGNAIEAHTRGVRAFTLLLSPAVFDFASPVTVTVNGRAAFEGRVTSDPAVLLKWAARDNDRTMLFGAELKITP